MKKKIHILVLLAFAICQNTFGQTTINDFEGDNSKIVERNGAKHSIIESSKVGQSTSLMLNNFEPGLPNTVARHGAAISVVANPLKDAINDTDNVIKVGRTGDKWFELFAFPVETYTIPANTTRYLSISVKYDAQPDIVIRVDGEDEFSNGDPTVAIRAINKYTDFGNWQKLYFPLEGGQNGAEIKAVIIFSDAGFTNSPSGYILNNTDKFGYLDEIAINETDGANNTQEEYLKSLKEELVVNWPNNRTINVVFHGHSIPSGYFQTPTVKTLESYPHKTLEKLSAK